jgi:RNA polymerase sigma factor (sigma-70 family)
MNEKILLADRFEEIRPHLRAVAYRMLGSLAEADDAVQETWVRMNRADLRAVENLGGWLTTVVGRVCLDMLRSRKSRREDSLSVHVPDPIVSRAEGADPEQEAELVDSIGLALLVVLDTLAPAERLAFVLHDMFAVSFDEIAEILGRTSASARQLASRARRRVQDAPTPDADLPRQRQAVDAFFAAARAGDFDAPVAVLDPDVVLRADGGLLRPEVSALARGAETVAGRAIMFSGPAASLVPVVVNGGAGVVVAVEGRPVTVFAFTVVDGRVVEIEVLGDPERLAQLVDMSAL